MINMSNILRNNDIMIDIETLGTSHNSVIATIGAMKFNRRDRLKPMEEMKSFYQRIDIDSCSSKGMTTEEVTVQWWQNQDEKSRDEIYNQTDRVPIEQALNELSDFIGNGNVFIWAQGPHFDCTILENAYKQCNLNLPWKFWNVRDCRTILDVCNVRLKDIPGEYPHHSLYDCYKQIIAVKTSFDKLREQTTHK
jgi:hypothetical protein